MHTALLAVMVAVSLASENAVKCPGVPGRCSGKGPCHHETEHTDWHHRRRDTKARQLLIDLSQSHHQVSMADMHASEHEQDQDMTDGRRPSQAETREGREVRTNRQADLPMTKAALSHHRPITWTTPSKPQQQQLTIEKQHNLGRE